MTKKKPTRGIQQGPQKHAEGGHGAKTREFFRTRQITRRPDDDNDAERSGPRHDAGEIRAHDTLGKDRLFEHRQQHDEAEKNSESTRLSRDKQRHRHDNRDDVLRDKRQVVARRTKR